MTNRREYSTGTIIKATLVYATTLGANFLLNSLLWQSSLVDASPTDAENALLTLDDASMKRASIGSVFRVNTFTTDRQQSPSVAALENGNFVAVWSSTAQANPNTHIYGQLFDPGSVKIGNEFLVSTYIPGFQIHPTILAPQNGNFYVAWTGTSADTASSYDIFLQIFDLDTNRIGNETRINTNTQYNQFLGFEYSDDVYCTSSNSQIMAPLKNANIVITWSTTPGSGYDVAGQIITATGAKVGSEFMVNTYTTSSQYCSSVAGLNTGNFIVVWQSAGQDPWGDYGIFGQLFDSSAAKIGSEFLVNTYYTKAQWRPTVHSFANGNFLVDWACEDGQTITAYQTWVGQLFTVSATKIGGEFLVDTSNTPRGESRPPIVELSNSNFLLIWQQCNQKVYQLYDATATKVGNLSIVDAVGACSNAGVMAAAKLKNKNFVVLYDGINDGNSIGVFGQQFCGELTTLNSTQTISYIEDTTTGFSPIKIDSPNAVVTAALQFSDPSVGRLTTATSGSITSTYDTTLGMWKASGLLANVNILLTGTKYLPTLNFNGNFSISLTVTDQISNPTLGSLTMIGIPVNDDPPILGNNSLFISEGQTVILTSASLSASDPDTVSDNLVFTVSNVQGGRFEFVNAPGTSITSFTVLQINNGQVQFVQDGSETSPSYLVSVRDQTLSTAPAAATVTFIKVNDPPLLVNNQLTINEGQSLLLTQNILSASDPDNTTLIFTVSNVLQGRFELITAPGVATTTFTNVQIANSQVRFVHDGSEIAPSYVVTVSDGIFTTNPVSAAINFNRASDAPVITINQMIIIENQFIILSRSNLDVADPDTPPDQLLITVSNVVGGHFELLSNSGVTTTSFFLSQIDSAQVKFIQNGAEGVSFSVSVSDGQLSTATVAANITFINQNDPPQAIKAVLDDQVVEINKFFSFIISPNTTFFDPDSDPLVFSVKLINGSAIPQWLNFDPLTVRFFGTSTLEGREGLQLFATDPSNTIASVNFSLVTSPPPVIAADNTPVIAGSAAGGAVVLGGLIGLTVWYRRHAQDKSSREKHELARYIRRHLKLQAIDNFESEQGQQFVTVIQKLVTEFSNQGLTLTGMDHQELDKLSKEIALSAKNKISTNTTFWGKSIISVSDFDNKIADIVQGVLRLRVGDSMLQDRSNDTSIEMVAIRPAPITAPQINTFSNGDFFDHSSNNSSWAVKSVSSAPFRLPPPPPPRR